MSAFESAFPAPATARGQVARPLRAATVAAALPLAAVALPASASAAVPPTWTYVVSGPVDETHVASGEDGDTGLCAATETAHFAGSFRFRVVSTRAGLTDDEVLALRDGGPDPSVVSAEYTQGGSLVIESGQHVYTTRWTDRDAVRSTSTGVVVTGRFAAVGQSESGSPFAIHTSGRLVLVDGVPALDRSRASVLGCLP
jgi:hypothetical protein